MMEIVDLDNCKFSRKNGTYGGAAGNKDGIIYNGEYWLIKYPKNIMGLERTGEASYSTSPLSEFLGSHIYDILGYDVHETMLAARAGKIVVACKDFTIEDDLIEIRTIKNHANGELAQLLEEDFSSTGSDIRTRSYSSKLGEYSRHYKTYSNVLEVRILSDPYLIATKLMAGRSFKRDLSDLLEYCEIA